MKLFNIKKSKTVFDINKEDLPLELNPTQSQREKNINNIVLGKEEKLIRLWDIIPFLLIVIFSLICHSYILKSKFLYGVEGTDSTVQMMYFLPFLLKELFLNGSFWSWHYGMGGDIFSEFSYYYTTSPFILILVPLIPYLGDSIFTLEGSLKLKLAISIYKQILIMLAMYFLLRYEKRSRNASLAASFIYGGAIYYMWNSNYFDFMTNPYLWVPLMVLGFRIYENKKNYFPLLISAALAAINNFYFAYHTYIFFILFLLIMIEPKGNNFKELIKSYLLKLKNYAVIGIGALLLSSVTFLPQIFAFIKIDRFSKNNPVSLFFESNFYKNMPINMFFNSSTLGIPMIIILALFLNYRKTTERTNKKVILLVFFTILYCLPFTGYFFNGMNYHSERWFYLLIFVFAYSISDIVDEVKKKNYFNIAVTFILFLIFTSFIYFRRGELANYKKYLTFNAAVLMFNLFMFLCISIRKYFSNKTHRKIIDYIVTACIAGVLLFNNFAFNKDQNLNMNTKLLSDKKMVSKELDEVFSKLRTKDNEFFRVVFRNNSYENVPTYYKFNGISTFSSMTDGNMHDFLKRVLNIRHDIVYLSSFSNLDDRNYLESLLSVKYIVTGKGDYMPPPTYELFFENKSYSVFKAKDTVGMDLWYSENLSKDKFLKLQVAEKDLNILNYAITEEKYNTKEATAKSAETIELGKDVLKFNSVNLGKDNKVKFSQNSYIEIDVPKPYVASQIYLHAILNPIDKLEFNQTVNNKKTFKAAESNPYVYHINEFTFAINGNQPNIRWSTNEKEYKLEDFYLKRLSLENLKDTIKERNKYNLENLYVNKNTVKGTINNKENGFLVLNIPYNKGWSAKINGKNVELKRMNGILTGLYLEKGNHDIELTFLPRGLKLGFIISLITLLLSLIYFFKTREQRLQYAKENKIQEEYELKKLIYNNNLEEKIKEYKIKIKEIREDEAYRLKNSKQINNNPINYTSIYLTPIDFNSIENINRIENLNRFSDLNNFNQNSNDIKE